MSDTLRALQLPAAAPGVMSRDTTWRVMIDGDSAPRLYLIHQIAALVLPDGPFELLAPLTYFRFDGVRWQQATQERGGSVLPSLVAQQLATEFTDRERIYFYRIRIVDVGRDASSAVAGLRADVNALSIEGARLKKSGFIGADAEP